MALTRLRTDELAYSWIDDGSGAPLQLALLGIFDAGPFYRADGSVDVERVRGELAVRALRVASLGRRVVWTRPGEGRPVWAADPAYDPRDHIVAVPLPAGADLGSWAATRAVRPLDRDRPLWRADVIDGLPGVRFAVLITVSHVLADGLAGVVLAASLLDPTPDTCVAAPSAVAAPPPLPAHGELVRDRVRGLRGIRRRDTRRGDTRRGGGAAAAPTRPPSAARPGLRQIRATLAGFAGPEPATSLARAFGPLRRLAVVRYRLDELETAGHALGATVNDLVLAGVTGGLHRFLTARGEGAPDLRLRCNVPVATGRPGRQVLRMLLVALPVGEPDPLRQLELIHRATAAGKAGLRAGSPDLTDLHLPLVLARWLLRTSRRLGSRRLTLSVTDIPGPTAPLWLAGARMLTALPVAPLAPLVPLSVAALSYAGELVVTANVDRAVTDLGVLAAGIGDTLAELSHLAHTRAAG